MQFHQDGFRPGDPRVALPAPDVVDGQGPLPDEVDVLVVGAGPAGLTLAAQLSAFADVTTRVVEQKPDPMTRGQADGVAVRTMEVFDALGFAGPVLEEAYWVNETTFWRPDPEDPTRIVRHRRIEDTPEGLSRFPHVILNQARVHDHLLDVMRRSPRRLEVDQATRVVDVRVPDDPDARVEVVLEHLDGDPDAAEGSDGGERTTVRARYVVGCDGARSSVREAIGRRLRGDSANRAWGVMDVLVDTDFPDVRRKAAVQSADAGSLLVIPREGGHLVRLYVELDELAEGERVANRDVTVEHLVAAARRILSPHTLEVHEVAWWSVYEIGQRLTDRFDDVPEALVDQRDPRVFIAGDACHTHSPKAGQGMNVSIRDAFNLGWKLAAVLQGRSGPQLLRTYSEERQAVAAELIAFDRDFAAAFAAPAAAAAARERTSRDGTGEHGPGRDGAGEDFQAMFVRKGRYTAGVETHYAPSLVTAGDPHQQLAAGFVVGTRLHSAPVVRLADARPMHLGDVLVADGRWRLLAFGDAADPGDPTSALHGLCHFLADDPASPLRRHTPAGADPDAVLDLRAVLQQPHDALEPTALHPVLRPRVGTHGLVDHEKVFCPSPTNDVFDLRRVSRSGAMVLVRPDHHVAHILPLTAHAELSAFLSQILLPT